MKLIDVVILQHYQILIEVSGNWNLKKRGKLRLRFNYYYIRSN